MAISCKPSDLLAAARCFGCIPKSARRAVRTYLLCNFSPGGSGPVNIVPPGSVYTGDPATFTLAVSKFSTYQITWGANDLKVTVGGQTFNSGGAGTSIQIYTGTNATMVFTGTFNGTTVTLVVVILVPAVPAAPVGFTWAFDGPLTHVVGTWPAPGAGMTKTELWTSTNNITYALAATVAAPGTTATVAAPGAGVTLWGQVRYCTASTSGQFSAALSVTGLNATATDWAARVVVNGGAAPSGATVSAISTFANALKTAAIDTKMFTVCCFVPDSLIAAITPLYKVGGNGNDPWTNTAFVIGDLTINGLKGDGATKSLAIGTNPVALGIGNLGGLTVYCSSGNQLNEFDIGSSNAGQNFNCWVRLAFTTHGAQCQLGGTTPFDTAQVLRQGFYSGNRTSAISLVAYFANSITPFASIGSSAANDVQPFDVTPLTAFSFNLGGIGPSFLTSRRHSFMAFHKGLTATEAQNFFNAIQALRVALGGGSI